MTLFHILHRNTWQAARAAGTYAPESLRVEGFIHFSTDRQLLNTAKRFYRGQHDLVVISVREDKLTAELRYEAVHDSQFPHLYGALNVDAVVEAVELPWSDEHEFVVPEAWVAWSHYFT